MHNEASHADALFEQRTASSNGDSSTSDGAAREANEQGPSRKPQPASSGGVTAGDWYGQARQGHSLTSFVTSEAARLREETRQGEVQVQSLCICWDLDPVWHYIVSFLATELQPEEIHRLAGL